MYINIYKILPFWLIDPQKWDGFFKQQKKGRFISCIETKDANLEVSNFDGIIPLKTNIFPWKSMVGRCISYWNGPFWGDTLIFWGASQFTIHWFPFDQFSIPEVSLQTPTGSSPSACFLPNKLQGNAGELKDHGVSGVSSAQPEFGRRSRKKSHLNQ